MKTPQEVAQEFRDFLAKHEDADFTFGHVVLADFNVSTLDIEQCFTTENLRQWATEKIMNEDNDFGAIEKHYLDTAAAITFLRHLYSTYYTEFLEEVGEILLADE